MLEIIKVKDDDELFCQYPGQYRPQPVFIQLDPLEGTLHADYSADNMTPFSVWHGLKRRYHIRPAPAEMVNELMEQIAPLAERVAAGWDSEWDGSNNVGTLTEDAVEAEEEIEVIINGMLESGEFPQVVDASAVESRSEWLDIIPADMTDEELEAEAAVAEKDYFNDGDTIVVGVLSFFDDVRELARELAEDEEDEGAI